MKRIPIVVMIGILLLFPARYSLSLELPPIENPARYEDQIVWVGPLGDNLAVLTSGLGTLLALISPDGTLKKVVSYRDFIAVDAVTIGDNLYVLTMDTRIIEINRTGDIVRAVYAGSLETSDGGGIGIKIASSDRSLYMLWFGDGLYLSKLRPGLTLDWTVRLQDRSEFPPVILERPKFDLIPSSVGIYILESILGISTNLFRVTADGGVQEKVVFQNINGIHGAAIGDSIYVVGTVGGESTLGVVALQWNDISLYVNYTIPVSVDVKISREYFAKTSGEVHAALTPESLTVLERNILILVREENGNSHLLKISKDGKFLKGISLQIDGSGKLGNYKDNVVIASTSGNGINVYLLSGDMGLKWAKTFMRSVIVEKVLPGKSGYWIHLKTEEWPWGYVLHYSPLGTVDDAFRVPEGRSIEEMVVYRDRLYALVSNNGSEILEDVTEGISYLAPNAEKGLDSHPAGGGFLSSTKDGLLVKFSGLYSPYLLVSPGDFKEVVIPRNSPVRGGLVEGNRMVFWGSGYIIVIDGGQSNTATKYSVLGGMVLGAAPLGGVINVLVNSGGMLCLATIQSTDSYEIRALDSGPTSDTNFMKVSDELVFLSRWHDLGHNNTKILIISKNSSVRKIIVDGRILGILGANRSVIIAYGENGVLRIWGWEEFQPFSECNWLRISGDSIGVQIRDARLRTSSGVLQHISPEEFYRDPYYRDIENVTVKAIEVTNKDFKEKLNVLSVNGTKVNAVPVSVEIQRGNVLYTTKEEENQEKGTEGICGPGSVLFFMIIPLVYLSRRTRETF